MTLTWRMIKFFAAAIFSFLFMLTAHSQGKVMELKGKRMTTTPKLSQWKPDRKDPLLKILTRDQQGLIFARNIQPLQLTNFHNGSTGADPVWQQRERITEKSVTANTPLPLQSYSVSTDINFDGIGFTNISPADPTIAVGPGHIIQMVNGSNGSAYFSIYTKSGGQIAIEAFMDQLPGSSYNGAGDCITWYDQLEDRYVMTEFGDSSSTGTAVNCLIVAVSATNNPLGAWHVYEFPDASFFPDYPKYSNWHDAWFGMTRDFVGSYIGNSVWAFDKKKMIRGEAVTSVQRIRLVNPDNKYNSLCPVSLAGNTPAPAGTPGMFLYFSDDDFTREPGDQDSLGLVGFNVDFSDPASSTVGVIESLPVEAFSAEVCIARSCAPSAAGQGYDVISSRIMNKPYYRNFGTHQSIVANHTVDATGTGIAGIRWYELRKTTGSWTTFQQGTFAPQEIIPCVDPAEKFRFMGSMSINAKGQMAMAYNTSSASSYASIGFTGRNASDPRNAMSYDENIVAKGTGFGSFGNRWGDYSEMVSDVSNDSIFWFTGMYGTESGWKTKIFSIKLGKPKQTDARLISIDKPNACESSCNTNVEPQITVRNMGLNPITAFQISYRVNSNDEQSIPWTGNISIGNEIKIKLPAVAFPQGKGKFSVRIGNINGLAGDEDPGNDSLVTQTAFGEGVNLPVFEGFETNFYPPIGWSRISDMTPAANWERNTNAARTGIASVYFNNFDQNQPSRSAELRSPLIKLTGEDSLELSFSYAAAIFDQDNVDTLEILVSRDCGNSFESVWLRNTQEIATREGNITTPFIPLSSEWRRISIDLNNFTNAANLVIAFRNINGFGNMVYLDDISIIGTVLPALDLAIAKIVAPAAYTCGLSVRPVVSFINLGRDTIRSATFMYNINGDVFRTINWQGSLPRRATATITLPETQLSPGNHFITIYGSNPNQKQDQNQGNDSLAVSFQIKTSGQLPLTEGFEGVRFPPDQWNVINPDNRTSWVKFNLAANTGQSSVYVNNYNNRLRGRNDQLVMPLLSYRNADSVFLDFKLSAVGSNPGMVSPAATDTLEILVTSDCGKTFTSVYKKWGKQLQTINDNEVPFSIEYYPRSPKHWRQEKIDLTPLLGGTNEFIAIFSNTSNGINNIYLDDVAAYTRSLPVKLKNTGYLITPNPFRNSFIVEHYPNASVLRGIEVFNSTGQLIYQRRTTQGGDSYIEINLSNRPAGIYFVKLTYADKVITERLLKSD